MERFFAALSVPPRACAEQGCGVRCAEGSRYHADGGRVLTDLEDIYSCVKEDAKRDRVLPSGVLSTKSADLLLQLRDLVINGRGVHCARFTNSSSCDGPPAMKRKMTFLAFGA